MERRLKKRQKVVKGTPAAVLISILIHAMLFLLAGMFVVFTVVKQKEVEFAPPKAVERPKMKLKKPKVKVKKTSKPRPTTRIVTKVQKASMPDIQLPEISGMAEGLTGGDIGFDLMPDLAEATIFGSGQTIGNDFEGTFYDFLKDRKGRWIQLSRDYNEFLRDFVKNGWKESYFSRYYRSPKKLYATTCMFPLVESIMARVAFGEFEEGQRPDDYKWAILYKGQLVCPASYTNGITFRFWGEGSSFLIVRVDGETVLDAPLNLRGNSNLDQTWHSKSADSYKYWIGNGMLTVGDWITLEPGDSLDMEYLFSDWGGGEFSANLLVEVKGEKYPRNRQGGPILPVFKTAPLSFDQQDRIMEFLVYDSADLTNGPVFCDYDSTPRTQTNLATQAEVPSDSGTPKIDEHVMRSWTFTDGRKIEARFKTVIMGNVLLENERGKQKKIPLAQLSAADREFAELCMPPEFNIEFSKTSSMRTVPPSHLYGGAWPQPKLIDYTFGVTLKQISAGSYNHPLTVEYFAIGKQINSSATYILLDRQKTSFIPMGEEKNRFEFHGDPVLLFDYVFYKVHMGQKPVSFLVTISDKHGKIIQYATPKKWLFTHLENLKQVPVGRFMDKTCTRVHPECPDIGSRRDYDRL